MHSGLNTYLGVGVKSRYVRDFLAKSNMEALRSLSIFFTAFLVIALASTFAPIPPWIDRPAETLGVYRIGFVTLCAIAIAFHLMAKNYLAADNPKATTAFFIAYSYIIVVLALGTALTLYDFPANRNFFLYVVTLVLVFGLLSIPPAFTIGMLIIFSAVMAAYLILAGFREPTSFMALCAYDLIAIVVSASNFRSQLGVGRANEQIISMSLHDELTGTNNRRSLQEHTADLVGRPLYLLVCDIDEFKFYNDMYGHASGDGLLVKFSQSLQSAFGKGAVYRFGGDEFVVAMRTDSQDEFDRAVERWRQGISEVEIEGIRLNPTMSGGFIGGTPHCADDVQSMLRIADIYLYEAKQSGRNKVIGVRLEDKNASEALEELTGNQNRRANNLDELTGLPSMMYFSTHAKTIIESPALSAETFYFVYFNVENLKIYNERFGFGAGDDLLVFTAKTIEESFDDGLVARFGDDRFVLLAYGDGIAEGIERVYKQVRSFNEESNTVVRAGIYEYEKGVEISGACDRAKLACDFIKGRYNVYYYFYESTLMEARNRQQFILDRFDNALASGHIKVYYQPILRTVGPRICELEGLARWIDPDGGIVSPADFIPVLEEFRLIHRLDLHILEQACKNYRLLADEGIQPVPTNINLSRLDMELCDVVTEVDAIMKRYDVPPTMIHIEITESAFAENHVLLRSIIERFHQLGMEVWMDDFGSGYSSLNVLREFNYDVVKIDLQFLRHSNQESRERSKAMIPHMISMAKELGIQTLAEGVETHAQYDFLKSVGCEKLQGYLFGKPQSFEDVRLQLTAGPIEVEPIRARAYFDSIGKVNLLRPTTIDDKLSHEIELSSGLPAAVIEFRGGHVEYLLWNSSYEDYLVDIGMQTIENSEAQMNDLSRVQSQGFFKIADEYKTTSEWINLTFYEEDDLCTAMARCVSYDEKLDACSFVYIAFNLSKYLNRTGSSLPKAPMNQQQ